jgi:hypothetical protein
VNNTLKTAIVIVSCVVGAIVLCVLATLFLGLVLGITTAGGGVLIYFVTGAVLGNVMLIVGFSWWDAWTS